MPKEERQIKEITDNDLDTGRDLVTENYELEILTLKDKVDLRRFSRSFLKVDKLLKSIFTGKEDKFPKNSGFNRVKTDLAENDTNKIFSAKGAFDLKTSLENLITNLKNTLTTHVGSLVSTTQSGHMSKEDKVKLNGIANNANNYIHPTTSGNKHIPTGGGTNYFVKWASDGTGTWGLIDWSFIQNKPSSFPPTSHTHTSSQVGLGNVPNTAHTTAATANTVPLRDSAGDITARLMRSNYGDESRMTGGVAFRINTSDNYIRFCNSPSAFRGWLGVTNITSTNGATFRIHSDGFKEAWGSATLYDDESQRTINLPFSFSRSDYNVSFSFYSSANVDITANLWRNNTSSLRYQNNWSGTRGTGTMFWYVCGF